MMTTHLTALCVFRWLKKTNTCGGGLAESENTLFVGIAGLKWRIALHVDNQPDVTYNLLGKANVSTFYSVTRLAQMLEVSGQEQQSWDVHTGSHLLDLHTRDPTACS